ncbi:hypothetical protein E2C01_030236 [Portunus trituberculatus]|uniref:Uncharacterized protein n=1 Tax=Portunus trituberculatus TaxID=210409 RepID=A0A5B7EUC3_PORTR|nr:hypothetical protein [Portunus trituberculatus]
MATLNPASESRSGGESSNVPSLSRDSQVLPYRPSLELITSDLWVGLRLHTTHTETARSQLLD